MIYPFSIVTLYSVIEYMKDDDIDTPVTLKQGTAGSRKKRTITVINFMLDYGLPFIIISFIIIFWVLGIINANAATPQSMSC